MNKCIFTGLCQCKKLEFKEYQEFYVCTSEQHCYNKIIGENMNTNPQTTTTPTKFWMVKTGTSGNSSASYHHSTKQQAIEECQRIAIQKPNTKVYLLEVISCFEVIDIPVKEIKL